MSFSVLDTCTCADLEVWHRLTNEERAALGRVMLMKLRPLSSLERQHLVEAVQNAVEQART